MREALKTNIKYKLISKNGDKTFFVQSIVGYGASCIVYDAYYLDDEIRYAVRLKECCPVNACEEERSNGIDIQWKNTVSKEKAFSDFERAYKRHSMMQLQYNFVNVTSKIIDCLYEGNNTKYIVMECDNGQSYEKIEKLSIYEKLKVLKALANTVNKYHEIGWLHLDLKPENFMLLPETFEMVKLFDFDSLVSIDAIQERRISTLSFSSDWAAPEVKQCKLSKIGPAADVYSIGAILYYMIFKQKLNVTSKLCYGNYIQPECIALEGTNPALVKSLNDFLKNTLAASKTKRYQDMETVIEKLNDMIHLADPSYKYLNYCLPIQTQYYYGREPEFDLAKEILDEGNLLVVSGIGGVGKSEFALNYAHRVKDKYDCVIWGKYSHESLEEFLSDSSIFFVSNIDKKESVMQGNVRYIKGLLKKGILLVIDDFNQFEDEFFHELLQAGADMIITTCINVEDYFSRDIIISLDCMETSVLKTIFYHYYERLCEESEDEYIEKLIERFDNYTLVIPLLAKQMKASSCTPKRIWEKMENTGLGAKFSERIVGNKDQVIRKDYLYNHVKNIFDLSQIGENEQTIIMALSLLGDLTVEKHTLVRWCSADYNASQELNCAGTKETDCTAINNLIELGWVSYDAKMNNVYLHDVIREVILQEIKPDYDNSSIFLNNVIKIVEEVTPNFYGYLMSDYKYTEHHARWYCVLLLKILMNLDKKLSVNERYIIEALELLDDFGTGLKFVTAIRIFLGDDNDEITLSINIRLKLEEWILESELEELPRNESILSLQLKKAIEVGNAVENWDDVSVYSGKDSYFRKLYWFIYKFSPEHGNFYNEFKTKFINLPDIEDIVESLRDIINYSKNERDISNFKELEKLVKLKKNKTLDELKSMETEFVDSVSSVMKNDLQEKKSLFLDQLGKEIVDNKRISNRMKVHLLMCIYRIKNLIEPTSSDLFYLKDIDINLFIPSKDAWEYLKKQIYDQKFELGDLHTKIWEMCELGSILRDISVYYDFSETRDQIVEVYSELSGLSKADLIEHFEMMFNEYNVRSLNASILIKEIQERCVENEDFKNYTDYLDEFMSQLLNAKYYREFLTLLDQYCELMKLSITPKVMDMNRDSHMVQYLFNANLDLFALKLLLDIIDLLEIATVETVDASFLQSNYDFAIFLAKKTDNEAIYYQLKEKTRKFTKIKLGYNESVKFSANNVNKVSILNEYINEFKSVESVADRENLFKKLQNEKQLDEKSKSILIQATKDKESILNVVFNKKYITPGAIPNEESLNKSLSLQLGNIDGFIYEKMMLISEVCLQAVLLERTSVLDKYVQQYISLQNQLFATRFDALDLMAYMTLPEILYQNDYEEQAFLIFASLDKIIQKYNVEGYGTVEKLLIFPYLVVIYGALTESDAVAEDIQEWNAKRTKYYQLREEIVNSL